MILLQIWVHDFKSNFQTSQTKDNYVHNYQYLLILIKRGNIFKRIIIFNNFKIHKLRANEKRV